MGTSMNASNMQNTGTRDVEYNLISIAYHALQGAETVGQYIGDVQGGSQGGSQGGQQGGQDVAQFFRDVQNQYKQTADRAKQLLRSQMQGQGSR